MEPLKILVFIVRCAKTCESVGSEHKCVSFQVTDVDSSEAKDVGDVPVSLGAKLDQYHSLNKELDFLVRNTFCGFAVIFICNLILFISLGNYQFSKALLIGLVIHWHRGSIIHPQKHTIDICIFKFGNFKYCPI